jgi:hypothetical protein
MRAGTYRFVCIVEADLIAVGSPSAGAHADLDNALSRRQRLSRCRRRAYRFRMDPPQSRKGVASTSDTGAGHGTGS